MIAAALAAAEGLRNLAAGLPATRAALLQAGAVAAASDLLRPWPRKRVKTGVTDEVRRLVDATDRCLAAAIDVCGPGVPVRKIGATIHGLADELGFGVVEKFVGHGVGYEFHSGPTVRHHRNNDPGTLVLNQARSQYTPVPVRPRRRGERDSLRTLLPVVTVLPPHAAFNPDTHRRL